ncbi:FtsX-like permease family protein [Indiicoccus explosivorum]|uniref:FtsX-like permease family protein n=1 Tax=Indiicoccus explosivorum TaxID=1917864 RepID=UPI000B42E238|nr:ABC transporter permease [Indiicoccus explosivorum]
MNSRFFSSLALRNIQANRQLYIPYVLASVAVIAMFHLMASLLTNEFVRTRAASLTMMFEFGTVVIAIFAFIFILYTNSFLIKRRKKEIGLYGILGLEKRHVAKVLLFEMLYTGLVSLGAGMLTGFVFGRLFFLLLNYMMNLPVQLDYSTTGVTALMTAGLSVSVFLLAFLYNISQFTFAKPVKLLKGSNEGEREPKGSVVLFVLSLAFLAAGYGISLSMDDPLSALTYFFTAVLAVIIGTYLLFVSGSIFILKALKRNSRFYYRPAAFISVSGMLYRMKQNAVGLANICILSTMVMITVSTTMTVFVGTEEILENQLPYENNWTVYGAELTPEELTESFMSFQDRVRETAAEMGLEVTGSEAYRFQSFAGEISGGQFEPRRDIRGSGDLPLFLQVIPVADYNRLIGASVSLAPDEALFYHSDESFSAEELTFGGTTYRLSPADPASVTEDSQGITETAMLVVPDLLHIRRISEAYYADVEHEVMAGIDAHVAWNTDGTQEEKKAYAEAVESLKAGYPTSNYRSRIAVTEEWYSMNGGFLFLGVFLGLLFTIGTVLITYFKQVSEGYDDRGKFQIMQKVGLDRDMIRDSTRSQLVWMFLLPIAVAVIHVLFAYPIVRKMLLLFGITSDRTWLLSFATVVVAFSVIYFMIYRMTSKVYYGIVR